MGPLNFSLSRPPFFFPKTFFHQMTAKTSFLHFQSLRAENTIKEKEVGKNKLARQHTLSHTIPSCTTFFHYFFLLFPFSTPFLSSHMIHGNPKTRKPKRIIWFSHSLHLSSRTSFCTL
jgi:hypothetical protein